MVWNALVLTVITAFLGLPHFLVLWNFFRSSHPDPWLYVHYLWSVAYWLALLGLPALLIARHRLSRQQAASGQALPSG